MPTRLVLAAGLALTALAPAAAFADAPAAERGEIKDARLVPTVRDNVFVGLKVYAIRPGGRFDQPGAKFEAGDLIEQVDGEPVTADAGARSLYDNVVKGKADATVTVLRKGAHVELHSKRV